MFFKKPPRTDPPTPPWLKWGIVMFVVAAFVMHAAGIRPPASALRGGLAANEGGGSLSWGLPSLETYKSHLIPGYGSLQMRETAPGKGEEAVCGQDVDIRYSESPYIPASPAQKAPATPPESAMKKLSFRIGGGEVPGALQESVIGMRTEGRREVLVPPERSTAAAGALRYDIELLKISPPLPPMDNHTLPLHIFDRQPGVTQPVRCGDMVKAHLKIWDMSGALLLDTHANNGVPLTFRLGGNEIMLGLEGGVLGMLHDGSRTLIIPPLLQKPLRGSNDNAAKKNADAQKSAGTAAEILHKLVLPEHQPIIVDVDLVP